MPMRSGWQKSSYCMNASDCVELARLLPETVGLRDSGQSDTSPVLTISAAGFIGLVAKIKRGDLDLR